MALSIVQLESGYYPFTDKGQPIADGSLYVGVVGTDPEVEGNQIAVSALHQDGTKVAIAQPISLSPGGVPSLNGSNVVLVADGDYAIKVLDKGGSQVYYHPRRALGDPVEVTETLLVFDTVAIAKEQTYTLGQQVETNGLTASGDGGHANYLAEALSTPLAGDHITDDGNFQLTLQVSGAFNVLQFGEIGGANDGTAINAALDRAFNQPTKGAVYAPGGRTYTYTEDIRVGRGVTFYGDGYSTDMVGTGGAVVIDNTLTGGDNYSMVFNMRIRRADSGIGFQVKGNDIVGGATRWIAENLWVIRTDGKSGTGVDIRGAWNTAIKSVFVSGWDTGCNIEIDGPDYAWALNGASWLGGQIEGNNTGLRIRGGIAVEFGGGLVIEANSVAGVVMDNTRSYTFDTCYFELNGQDFDIGSTDTCYNPGINSCYFNTPGTGGADHSILANLVQGLEVSNNRFERYVKEPILIESTSATGSAENNTKDTATTIGMVDVATNGADRFRYEDSDYALKETELTIATGAITLTCDWHTVDTESEAITDDLDTINGGTRGMVLRITPANGARDVVLTENGNIHIDGVGGTLTMEDTNDVATLIYRESTSMWLVTSNQGAV